MILPQHTLTPSNLMTTVQILTTALFTVTILGRSLSHKKWISLVILTVGVSIVSIPSSDSKENSFIIHDMTDHFFPRSVHELGQVAHSLGDVARELTKRSATYEGIEEDQNNPPAMDYSIGLFAALAVASLSGLTGVFFEKVLKNPHTTASVWIRNIQLSFYSIIPAFLVGIVYKDGEEIAKHGFFDGYSWVVWALIILQAFGGVLASLCIHYADNIAKNFATSISIIISFLFTVLLFTCEITLTVRFYVHSRNPSDILTCCSFSLAHHWSFLRPISTQARIASEGAHRLSTLLVSKKLRSILRIRLDQPTGSKSPTS